MLFRGPNKDGLYHFLPHANKSSTSALIDERVSSPQHSRLGHSALKVVRKVLSSFQLPFNSSPVGPLCRACLSSKRKQLMFAASQSQTTCPLELVFTYVWGPAPVYARSGSKYYVSFLDSFSKYTWLYPIHNKSDVTSIFIRFKSYVECFFGLKIKAIQSDLGGEYLRLTKLLQSHGISHRVSCPHTHQQNGAVEPKHRHIVESGLALLSHANMPIHFWDDAFSTPCYLINRMPTVILKNKSPFEVLFKCNPDYKFLRIFGCAY